MLLSCLWPCPGLCGLSVVITEEKVFLCLCDIPSGYFSGAVASEGGTGRQWDQIPSMGEPGAGLSPDSLVSSLSGLGSYSQLGGF